jgi:hypothetical protein
MEKNYIDIALISFSNFNGYTGNQPKNEIEYNELLNDNSRFIPGTNGVFKETAPTWSEIQNKVSQLEQEEELKKNIKINALNKLSALGLTEAEIKAILGN